MTSLLVGVKRPMVEARCGILASVTTFGWIGVGFLGFLVTSYSVTQACRRVKWKTFPGCYDHVAIMFGQLNLLIRDQYALTDSAVCLKMLVGSLSTAVVVDQNQDGVC